MGVANTRAVKLTLGLMESGQIKTRDLRPTTNVVHVPDERVAKFSLSYLDAFGYFKDELNQWDDVTLDDIKAAIGKFQTMFGLKRSKTLDVKTVRAMEAPRCGCPDVVQDRHTCARGLQRVVAASLPRWRKQGVTYAVADYLPGLPKDEVDRLLRAAFDAWTRYGNVDARPADGGTPDILVGHGRGKQSNFDGAGGTLAWAYLPDGHDTQLLMRFDLDESWTLTPQQRGILFYNVACHEVGHVFGLGHSRAASALMAPYYNAAVADPQADDDVPRFQALYGVRTAPPPLPPQPPVSGNVTISGRIDAVVLNGKKIGPT